MRAVTIGERAVRMVPTNQNLDGCGRTQRLRLERADIGDTRAIQEVHQQTIPRRSPRNGAGVKAPPARQRREVPRPTRGLGLRRWGEERSPRIHRRKGRYRTQSPQRERQGPGNSQPLGDSGCVGLALRRALKTVRPPCATSEAG